jgi:transposase
MDFVEGWFAPGLGRNERLDRITAVIDWAAVERLVATIHSAAEGRKAYPPLVMVKALLLQQWYSLSDSARRCARRISMRRCSARSQPSLIGAA